MAATVAVVLSSCAAIAADAQGDLETESSLFYRNNGRRFLVKHLQPTQEFQGFAVTRDGNIFLTYSGTTSEPTTIISIYDVKLRTERVMIEIGSTGGTGFAYDVATDLVAFSWEKGGEEGVYVFALDAIRKIWRDPANLDERFFKSIVLAARCVTCSRPCWTRDGRIAYLGYDKSGFQQRSYATVPESALPAGLPAGRPRPTPLGESMCR
jgi:hypothetical protein